MTIKKPGTQTRIPHNREPYKKLEEITESDNLDRKTIQRLDQIRDPETSTHELIQTILDADSGTYIINKTWECLESRVNGITYVNKVKQK